MISACGFKNRVSSPDVLPVLSRLVLNIGRKVKAGYKAPLNKMNISAEVEIGKLRSINDYNFQQAYYDQGLAFFDLPIVKTPHFQFIDRYRDNTALDLRDTSYWKLADFTLSLYREKFGPDYIYRHNKRKAVDSAEQMCRDFIELYKKIRAKGCIHPIEVRAMHDGKYRITDGIHRAAIACSLGLRKITARVTSLDSELLKLMEALRDAYPCPGHKVLYIPIDHPVFSDWKALRDETRWELIKDEFAWKDKKILDVGSYTGYFSHKITAQGGVVTGIETDRDRLAQAEKINLLLGSNAGFVHADFHQYLQDRKFDCIIFFSVLHWVLKEKGLQGVKDALRLVSSSSPVMFFDMGQDNEPKMNREEWNHGMSINKDTIPGLVIGNSSYRYCKHLGTGDTGRDVFKFSTEPAI